MLITKVWKSLPGKYFCLSTKDAFKKWEDHFFSRSEFGTIPDFIKENSEKDIYWCPHGFIKPRRLKKYADIPPILWADLDECDPTELDAKKLMPTIAWESSPGRFCGIWRIDTLMTEDMNQTLTHFIGADKGGWDLTQVLRVPGTKNYKYLSTPTVRTLWSDGPEHKAEFIESLIPKKKKLANKEGIDPLAIYKKYEKNFTTFIRRELLNGKPKKGFRSEIIWKLAHGIIEAGATTDEAFELLRVSPWNKFKERRDGDAQLKRELDKALKEHISVSVDGKQTFKETEEESDEDEDDEEYIFLGKSMDQIQEENINWIWYPYLARGQLSILEGDPGLGKSYLAQIVCGYIADGKKLPSEKPRLVQGKIAYFDMENSPGSVTKKRLLSNKIECLNNYIQEEQPFSIDDVETLKRVHDAIAKMRPAVVVFDTINTYIGSTDTHKASDVQQAMMNFVDIARRHNCAVLALRHLTKSSVGSALYRGQGSISFAGAARLIMTVGAHPEEKDVRVMAMTKMNFGRKPKALTYRIDGKKATLQDDDPSELTFGAWVDLESDDLVSFEPKKRDEEDTSKKKSTEDFLLEMLEGGPVEFHKLMNAAEKRGFDRKTLQRAAASLGIVQHKTGFATNRISTWALKAQKLPDNEPED